MAPGTNVGAAHPVSMGKEKMDKVMMAKVLQDAQAYARSLAEKRGRNADWAVRMVRESSSITADQALKNNVIDVVAPDVQTLLSKIDGKVVEAGGAKVRLATRGAKVVEIETPFKYRLLSYISDPNVAYLLMMIGFYGILFEIYSPGTIFPGVIGGICLILAFYAFQTIPISYAGLFLIVLGVIFFILELKIVSHGLLSIAGIISLLIGSIMLIDLPSSWLSLSWTVDTGRSRGDFNILPRCDIICNKSPVIKGENGPGGALGEVGTAKQRHRSEGQGLRPRGAVGRDKRRADRRRRAGEGHSRRRNDAEGQKRRGTVMPIYFFVLVLVVIFLAMAIKILNEYERGVIFRLGRVLGKAERAGPHHPHPGHRQDGEGVAADRRPRRARRRTSSRGTTCRSR